MSIVLWDVQAMHSGMAADEAAGEGRIADALVMYSEAILAAGKVIQAMHDVDIAAAPRTVAVMRQNRAAWIKRARRCLDQITEEG